MEEERGEGKMRKEDRCRKIGRKKEKKQETNRE